MDKPTTITEEVLATLPEEVQKAIKERERKGNPVTGICVIEVEKAPLKNKPKDLVEEEAFGECYVGYLATPSPRVRSLALMHIGDPFKAGGIVVRNCWLGGDEELRTDEEISLFANLQAGELIEVHRGNLKRL